jgi:hypothetical protein
VATEPTPSSVPANPSEWAEGSQRTVAAHFIHEYKDKQYKCWHCRADSVFTAADQKYTYEVRKADINQQRLLCQTCWRRSNEIAGELESCTRSWSESKPVLRSDKSFLAHWLALLEERETYVPLRRDVARKNMLRKLLSDA